MLLIGVVSRRLLRVGADLWWGADRGRQFPTGRRAATGLAGPRPACSRTQARAASALRPATPVAVSISRATAPTGRPEHAPRRRSRTRAPDRDAIRRPPSRATRLLPMPGGPITFTTPPRPSSARSIAAMQVAISEPRPTRLVSGRANGRRAGRSPIGSACVHGFVKEPALICTPVPGRETRCSPGVAPDSGEHDPARRSHRFHPAAPSRRARRSRRPVYWSRCHLAIT